MKKVISLICGCTIIAMSHGSEKMLVDAVNQDKTLEELKKMLTEMEVRQRESNVYNEDDIQSISDDIGNLDKVQKENIREAIEILNKTVSDDGRVDNVKKHYKEAAEEYKIAEGILKSTAAKAKSLAKNKEMRDIFAKQKELLKKVQAMKVKKERDGIDSIIVEATEEGQNEIRLSNAVEDEELKGKLVAIGSSLKDVDLNTAERLLEAIVKKMQSAAEDELGDAAEEEAGSADEKILKEVIEILKGAVYRKEEPTDEQRQDMMEKLTQVTVANMSSAIEKIAMYEYKAALLLLSKTLVELEKANEFEEEKEELNEVAEELDAEQEEVEQEISALEDIKKKLEQSISGKKSIVQQDRKDISNQLGELEMPGTGKKVEKKQDKPALADINEKLAVLEQELEQLEKMEELQEAIAEMHDTEEEIKQNNESIKEIAEAQDALAENTDEGNQEAQEKLENVASEQAESSPEAAAKAEEAAKNAEQSNNDEATKDAQAAADALKKENQELGNELAKKEDQVADAMEGLKPEKMSAAMAKMMKKMAPQMKNAMAKKENNKSKMEAMMDQLNESKPKDGIAKAKMSQVEEGDDWKAKLPVKERAAINAARKARYNPKMEEEVKRYFTNLATEK